MKYTKDPSGGVIRDDGALIPNDPLNADWQTFIAWVNAGNKPADQPAPALTNAQLLNMAQAQTLLDKSDVTLIRCFEHGVAVPQAWIDWRASLRPIAKTGTGTISAAPAYPAGT